MNNQENETSQDIMRPLRLGYLRELTERQILLELFMKKLEKAELDIQDASKLQELVHKLSGTGATYGFPQISEHGQSVEDLLINPTQPIPKILAGSGKNGLSENECDILMMLTRKLSLTCTELEFLKDAETAERLEMFLNSDITVPSTLVYAQLQRLLDACIAAHDQEPVNFSESSGKPALVNFKKGKKMPLVLIVDDENSAREVLSARIGEFADVISCTNAQETFELVRRNKPDLILLDDAIPGDMSGSKLLERLKDNPSTKAIPVMVMSSSNQPDVIEGIFEAGAVDYITKPVDPDKLSTRVKARLNWLGTTIMIVDDDKDVCDVMSRALAAAGFVIQSARDGQVALDMMKQSAPDLVLLDWMLPGIEGPDVLEIMRKIPQLEQVPVIFMTARREVDDILAGIDMDVIDYVVKPFNPDEVVACCIDTLGAHTALSTESGRANKKAS